MKKYLEAAKVYLKVKLMWRVDLIFGFISIVMKIIFASLLWGIIFRDREMVAGFTKNSMMTYYLLSAFFAQIDISEKISGDITLGIRSGTFSKYMTVPASYCAGCSGGISHRSGIWDQDKYHLRYHLYFVCPGDCFSGAAFYGTAQLFSGNPDISV